MNYLQTESAPTLWVLRGVLGQNYTRLSVAESVRCDKVLAKFAVFITGCVCESNCDPCAFVWA